MPAVRYCTPKIVIKQGDSLPAMQTPKRWTQTWNKAWPPSRAARFFRAAWTGTAFTIFVCAGCADHSTGNGTENGRLEIDPAMAWRNDQLVIDTGVQFDPTPRMREALESGVDLQLEVITRASRRLGPVAIAKTERRHPITIRFLPLTEQWQMEFADRELNFPRLWLLLDALQQQRGYATGFSREQARDGQWQVQARARFNREALPPPMHLPSLLSPQWRLAGAWHTWQLDAS